MRNQANIPMTEPPVQFRKLRITLRYLLQGAADQDPRYLVPLKAFEFAANLHQGTRKDGVTPEFMHQIDVALYVRTLSKSLMYPAETIAAALLHDTVEDYEVSLDDVANRFGDRVAHAVKRLTKVLNGRRLADEEYFEAMLDCPIASVVKGGDRINNQQTMLGVFRLAKQQEYISESETHILPMIKAARRRYPEQEAAYENLKLVLRSQVQLLRAVHAAQTLPPTDI